MSSLDENRRSYTLYRKDLRLTHIDDRLANAVRKRAALVADEPNLAKLPLLVAFFFDVFADHLHLYPRTFDKEVSGILTIKRDDATIKAFEQLSPAERERRLFDPRWADGLPTSGKVFVLVRNKAARRKVPKDFQLHCHTEPYDELYPDQSRGWLPSKRKR